ncbi:MAG: TIGR01777 family protein [Anaerolineaceae bacterium]|nr:TIGR01777 family protein [Anaerolineaceae bacterium]MCB9100644.1 TIGR01777 family protein [Anaerolineales bacterium]
MRVLITGGTGTIGRRLTDLLLKEGYEVTILSRKALKPARLPTKVTFLQWDGKTAKGWGNHLDAVDAVVNLAGAGIADERWTAERKKLILNSRVNAGQAVVEAFELVSQKPQVLIQASGVNYYGMDQEKAFTEADGPGHDFLAEVCIHWEAATAPVEAMGVRRVIIRTGAVLDPAEGALPKLAMPVRFFIGGPLGSGRQWLSWIHYADEIGAIKFLIETEAARGPINLTSPQPVRNKELAQAIGRVLHRPAIMPAPGLAVKLMVGELADVVLEGQKVVPAALQRLGYSFQYPQLDAALKNLLRTGH